MLFYYTNAAIYDISIISCSVSWRGMWSKNKHEMYSEVQVLDAGSGGQMSKVYIVRLR